MVLYHLKEWLPEKMLLTILTDELSEAEMSEISSIISTTFSQLKLFILQITVK